MVLGPFTSLFFMRGKETPWLTSQNFALSTPQEHNKDNQLNDRLKEQYLVKNFEQNLHISITSGLLSSELIARESQYDQTLITILLVH